MRLRRKGLNPNAEVVCLPIRSQDGLTNCGCLRRFGVGLYSEETDGPFRTIMPSDIHRPCRLKYQMSRFWKRYESLFLSTILYTANQRNRVIYVIDQMVAGYLWRRERDSNPRYGDTVYTLSKRAPSATRPPLRKRRDNRQGPCPAQALLHLCVAGACSAFNRRGCKPSNCELAADHFQQLRFFWCY